jgi:NAD(P)-dependent dehydrogenase (short-subunit alcohol dehydrogenase family)
LTADNHWTTENIPDLGGKIAIVTGGNSGIGFETARALARKGVSVIVASRNLARGEVAAGRIRQEHLQADLSVMELDLADLSSVSRFADAFRLSFPRLDILVNNAGVMATPYGKTADGFEMQIGTNHLGHFALTGFLIDILMRTPGARIVTVSSFAHLFGRINFDDLNSENRYWRWMAYCQSKLANLLFAYELQRRLERAGSSAISVAAHPGYSATNLQDDTEFRFLNSLFAQSPEMGALPVLYAATASDVEGGDFYGPDRFFG